MTFPGKMLLQPPAERRHGGPNMADTQVLQRTFLTPSSRSTRWPQEPVWTWLPAGSADLAIAGVGGA